MSRSVRHLKGYYNLMESAQRKNKTRDRVDGYYEMHHIIPKSFGGLDVASNKVLLTAKEHYIAHYLLTKFTKHGQNHKMVYAFNMMNTTDPSKGKHRKVNAKMYEENKIKKSKIMSKLMSNIERSDEWCKRISDSHKGKTHTKEHTAKVLKTRKETKSGSKVYKFYDEKNNLKFTCHGNYAKFCKENRLPRTPFRESFENCGTPIYQDIKFQRKQLEKLGMVHMVGWYCTIASPFKIRKETNEKI